MARRKSWLDRVNPAKWLGRIVDALTPTPERRRGSRDFGRATPRPAPSPILDRGGASVSPYREVWDDEGGAGSFNRAVRFFRALPVRYDTRDEEMQVWESFVANMTKDTGFRYNDPGNPFWSAIGMNPRNFDWAGWRAAVWGGRHRTL